MGANLLATEEGVRNIVLLDDLQAFVKDDIKRLWLSRWLGRSFGRTTAAAIHVRPAINLAKTKLQHIASASRLRLGDQEIEEVNRYCYLDCTIIGSLDALSDDLLHILGIWNWHSFFNFGSKTWGVTKAIVTKLQVFTATHIRWYDRGYIRN